jgi:lysophospholipase L1-like esterase
MTASQASTRRPIVILGASYARGWKPEPVEGGEFVNRGEDGQQSWELLERFERDVVAAAPSTVVVWGCINDIFRSPRAGVDQAAARARDAFRQMVTLARSRGIDPVLVTEISLAGKGDLKSRLIEPPMRLLGRRSYQDYVNGHVEALNEHTRRLAAEHDLLLLDFFATLQGKGNRRQRRYATADGSHISAAGYAALSAYARPLIAERVKRRG